MNKKINMSKMLRISVISILFLNIAIGIGSATDNKVIIFAMNGANIDIDGASRGVMPGGGMMTITLPVSTYHTLKVTKPEYQDCERTFFVRSGTTVTCSMFPIPYATTAPIPVIAGTPTPVMAETLSPVIAETPTPVMAETPTPVIAETPTPYIIPRQYIPTTNTPTLTSVSSKYIEINSEPAGANVYFGNTFIGTTPFTYEVLYTQKITFKLPGYMDKVTYIEQLTRSPFKVYLAKSFI